MGKHPGYGWVPDLPDTRDPLSAAPVPPVPLPSAVDLGGKCTPVYDQGQLGSCTGNAIAGALDFERLRQELPAYAPSRLLISNNASIKEEHIARRHQILIMGSARIGNCPFVTQPGAHAWQAGCR
jgi:hypothetical protein